MGSENISGRDRNASVAAGRRSCPAPRERAIRSGPAPLATHRFRPWWRRRRRDLRAFGRHMLIGTLPIGQRFPNSSAVVRQQKGRRQLPAACLRIRRSRLKGTEAISVCSLQATVPIMRAVDHVVIPIARARRSQHLAGGTRMNFYPWVGTTYRSTGLDGLRILAVGESHYEGDIPATQKYTTDVVRRWVFGGRHQYFTKVAKMLMGLGREHSMPSELLQKTWNSISFYNYVQQLLPGPRVKPTAAMWSEAKEIFPRIVDDLQPQLVVVMGKGLGENFGRPPGIELCFTAHPSAGGFSYKPWSAEVLAARRKATGQLDPKTGSG